jgi:hypothetical protein
MSFLSFSVKVWSCGASSSYFICNTLCSSRVSAGSNALTKVPTSDTVRKYCIHLCKSFQHRALFVTSTGNMACPWLNIAAKAGDKIVPFPGEYTPFIIRLDGGAYKLVGPGLVTEY